MPRRAADALIFDSLRLEGGLFVPAVLEKAARGELPDQRTPADYQLPAGLSLLDEQGRAFRIATALWRTFDATRTRRDVDPARATGGFASSLLRDALGHDDLTPCREPVALGDRAFPITALARAGRIPIVVAPHALELDTPDERFAVLGTGARRRSATQLAQQFLNASPDATWALVTNGRQLRLLRDADTLTRPSFLEVDLELILRDQRYADFAAVWRLFHASRDGLTDAASSWESWRKQGQDQGERVRDGLRDGVTQALLNLGTGFVAHPANEALRVKLQSGELTVEGYFQQLLRLVYRSLFVFTAEERGLLHPEDESAPARRARETYAAGYAFRRLRDRSLRRSGFDRHGDLWTAARIVFRGLAQGESRLGLPALGGLFAPAQCPDLDGAQLENRALLTAMRHLRWSGQAGTLAAIDYRNMGPEELGSVYESLLELVPTVDLPARTFGFVGLTTEGLTEGNARKTSGSYYTPDCLVQELLDSALEPVIAAKLKGQPSDPAGAILSISVIDPACGSGHFLLAAARRLAERLAEVRAVEGAVTPKDYRHALREVIARCIHGVDRNPMALELARTALWLEGYEPGQPLSFLDHHLVCGDALLGLVSFESLKAGIPADAFKPLAGDSKEAVKPLAAANRAALKAFERRRTAPDFFRDAESRDLLEELAALEALPETNPLEVEVKAAQYTTFLRHARDSRLAQAADLVVGAFLAPKPDAVAAALCPTTQTLADLLFPREGSSAEPGIINHSRRLCREARVLHWPLAFAGVFARGGFDCVLGNPPWEVSQLGEEEFFASRDSSISLLVGAQRKAAIANLETSNPALWLQYRTALRLLEATNSFYRESGRFPLTAVGKLNTYPLFAETIATIVRREGRAGFIVPTGIATDDSTKDFFANLAEHGRLAALFDYENREKLFPAVDSRMKFCLMTLGPAEAAEFAFFLTQPAQLEDGAGAARRFTLSREDFRLINPNTRTCPVFRSQADAELTKKIYRRVPVLITEERDGQPEQNPWGISFSQGLFNMTSDSGLFLNQRTATSLPLYEAKMIHQFDHRWATYRWDASEGEAVTEDVTEVQKARPDFTVQPRYWVEEQHVLSRLARVPRCVTKAWDAQDEGALRAAFANWMLAASGDDALSEMLLASARTRVIELGGRLFNPLPADEAAWRDERAANEAKAWPPLTEDELGILRDARSLLTAARVLLDLRTPSWLIGWRRNCRSTDARTMIADAMPRAGIGDSVFLLYSQESPPHHAALLGVLNSLVLDYTARQKVGGINFSFYYLQQLSVFNPKALTASNLAFIVPRVLELTYTAHDLKPWAEDLGFNGPPFGYDPVRRAQLRAELDAYYARLYGLTRDELRYILAPADTHGPDYPTVTFPGLKRNEESAFGEYRTRRLVLAAWDAMN